MPSAPPGRVRGPFHGIPVAFKDNIDVLGCRRPADRGRCVDHRPRLDSRMAAGMRRGGAVVLGKANLDEFPFGDFGISSVGGTIGNAYDPSLSTAGSSGGSAIAVATSLAALGFGTDTCNSLSNPAAFASLATIRTTRGLTSRAGVMPLNTYNDAVGPMAKSVREVALALDQVAGTDPEDRGDAARPAAHISGSFAAGLDSRDAERHAHRRAAAAVRRLHRRARNRGQHGYGGQGAAGGRRDVVDVAIPDYDAKYAAARGSAPGSLQAGWTAYLSRGAKPGDKVLTIQDLLASGKLAPGSARRFEGALAPTPTGEALDEATRGSSPAAKRSGVVRRPDGSAASSTRCCIRRTTRGRTRTKAGSSATAEPGTCEESATTGLPQVTVPAGFIGGRYPFGVSFLGRLWDDSGCSRSRPPTSGRRTIAGRRRR